MSTHTAFLSWRRNTADFEPATCDRNHTVGFKNGQSLLFSAAPAYPGDAKAIDPEKAFVASLSSCQMLTFLAVAARKGLVVDPHREGAVGLLEKNSEGRLAMTEVVLRPDIRFGGLGQPARRKWQRFTNALTGAVSSPIRSTPGYGSSQPTDWMMHRHEV